MVIALRFLADDPRFINWVDALLALIRILNLSPNASTNLLCDEVTQGM
jgi:hypothetical protein